MKNFKVISPYKTSPDQSKVIESIIKGIDSGERFQTLMGVTGSGKTFSMAKIIEAVKKPALVLTHNKTLAAQLYREFSEFFPENAVEYFVSYYDYYQPEAYIPSRDMYIEKDSSINEEIEKLRLSTTNSLFTRKDVVVVSSVSCIYNLGSPEEYENKRIFLKVGEEYSREQLIKNLVSVKYERSDYDFTQ